MPCATTTPFPRATAARVQAVAKRLGYRPNPRVSALMAHIRQAQPITVGERIAFLWIDAIPGERPYRTMFDAARERAAQLGYALEEFWWASPGVSARRLQQILHSRGIVGLLISPNYLPNPRFRIDWNWSLFPPPSSAPPKAIPRCTTPPITISAGCD